MPAAGATKIMVIRHAEKPDTYNGQPYNGVDVYGSTCGSGGWEHLVTLGWQRAGGLVTLFAPPWGPKTPTLGKPQYLYAANPDDNSRKSNGPSQRPYETLGPVAAALGLTINKNFGKKDFKDMVKDAVAQPGVVLISWQHEDIPLEDAGGGNGISHYILKETGTQGTLGVCNSWPKGPNGARYDLVFVFDRPTGEGPITSFTLYPQRLLAGDGATAVCTD